MELTKEELNILSIALHCYDMEIANEEDEDYKVFLELRAKIEEAKYA